MPDRGGVLGAIGNAIGNDGQAGLRVVEAPGTSTRSTAGTRKDEAGAWQAAYDEALGALRVVYVNS